MDNEDNKAYELFFGIINPVGTEKSETIKSLTDNLRNKGYKVYVIRLSDLIKDVSEIQNLTCEADRINTLMDACNLFREKVKRGDAVALLGIIKVMQIRKQQRILENEKFIREKNAYIFDSLKHVEEVESLRKIYQDRFHAISIYSPKSTRVHRLAKLIKESRQKTYIHNEQQILSQAKKLIERDQTEPENSYGQNIREVFPSADLFITEEHSKSQIDRFLNLLFGARFTTPTLIEYGMFMAHSTALLSADLSRQVGAVILTDNGEIVATGCNEVPLPNGDFFWEGTSNPNHDYREFQLGTDANTNKKHQIIESLLKSLKKYSWLNPKKQEEKDDDLIDQCLYSEPKLLKGSRLASLIEFGRIIHAEMAAITTAARLGLSTKNTTLFCTTFPCHGCAKHIISSGIKRVYYIEPYPRSLTSDLFAHMVSIDGESDNPSHPHPVKFIPYIGIAPKNYFFLFRALKRKKKDGSAYPQTHLDPTPRLPHVSKEYATWETVFVKQVTPFISE